MAGGRSNCTNLALVLVLTSLSAFGQISDQYRQAAQTYNNYAAQCQNPAVAACYRSTAQYYNCVANQLGGGAACGNAPAACSGSCGGSSSTGSSMPGMGTSATGNAKVDNVSNAINLGVQLWSIFHKPRQESPSESVPESPAGPTPEEAAHTLEVERQNYAAQLLNDTNGLLVSLNGPASDAPTEPNAAHTLDSLLDNGQPSNASTSAISSLLGDSGSTDPPSTDATSTVAGLLDQPVPSVETPAADLAVQGSPIPTSEQIDVQETAAATSIGTDWNVAISKLQDASRTAFETLKDTAMGSAVDKAVDTVSPSSLEESAKGVISDFLATSPAAEQEPKTLGDMFKDRVVDFAAAKMVDFTVDKKDELACSDLTSELDREGCVTLQAPTPLSQIGLGVRKTEELLMQRFSNLWEKYVALPMGVSH